MVVRPRSVVLALSLGFGALLLVPSAASAAPTQDDVTTTTAPATFGGGGAATTVATTTTEATAEEPADGSSQQVTEGSSSESRLLTESRKLLATIAGLVIAAIGLGLLTLRYYRATAPVAPAGSLATNVPVMGTEAALFVASSGSTPVVDASGPDSLSVEPVSAPTPAVVVESDHRRSDADYEPHGTGEHDRVEIPSPTTRPGRAARAAALGRTSTV